MAKKTQYNKNIESQIINKQISQQHTISMDWWYRDKPLFKIFKVLNSILFYITVLLNCVIIYGNFLKIIDYAKNKNLINTYTKLLNSTISFIVGTAVLIVGYVFLKISIKKSKLTVNYGKKYSLIALITESIGSIVILITALNALVTQKISNTYATSIDASSLTRINFELFGYHIVPLGIIIFTALFLFIMLYKDSKDKEYLYNTLTADLFKTFTNKNPYYKEQDWQNHLDNFNIKKG